MAARLRLSEQGKGEKASCLAPGVCLCTPGQVISLSCGSLLLGGQDGCWCAKAHIGGRARFALSIEEESGLCCLDRIG